jgi:hypothetical protein
METVRFYSDAKGHITCLNIAFFHINSHITLFTGYVNR